MLSPFASLRALVAALALCLAGCDGRAASGDADRPQAARNLIWISLDTLRADRLGCYGYERGTTPALDALAAQGTIFTDASAPSPWTMPSHASLFTGTYPQRNGVVGFETALSPEVVHVATLLADAGFQTTAVVSNSALTLHDLQRGFERFRYTERGKGPAPSDVTKLAIAEFDALNRDERFFALVHYNGVHARYRALPRYERQFVGPYDGDVTGRPAHFFGHATGMRRLSDDDVRHLSELYDAALRQLDDQLARLFDHLREGGFLDDTLVVVTSDHGEEFLDHGELNHAMSQYQELVRVPLLVIGPSIPAGRTVADPVALIDVLPTSLGLLGLRIPDGLDGVDLGRVWSADADALGAELRGRLLFFDADCAPPKGKDGVLRPGSKRAVRNERFKLHYDVDTEEVALFDLANDPTEQVDVKERFEDEARELLVELKRFLAAAPAEYVEAPLSEDELRRLQDLGYVHGED